jgi:hypothetical protein
MEPVSNPQHFFDLFPVDVTHVNKIAIIGGRWSGKTCMIKSILQARSGGANSYTVFALRNPQWDGWTTKKWDPQLIEKLRADHQTVVIDEEYNALKSAEVMNLVKCDPQCKFICSMNASHVFSGMDLIVLLSVSPEAQRSVYDEYVDQSTVSFDNFKNACRTAWDIRTRCTLCIQKGKLAFTREHGFVNGIPAGFNAP